MFLRIALIIVLFSILSYSAETKATFPKVDYVITAVDSIAPPGLRTVHLIVFPESDSGTISAGYIGCKGSDGCLAEEFVTSQMIDGRSMAVFVLKFNTSLNTTVRFRVQVIEESFPMILRRSWVQGYFFPDGDSIVWMNRDPRQPEVRPGRMESNAVRIVN